MVDDPPFAPGTTVAGKYRILRRVGEGGQGIVLEAEHIGLGNKVAIKILRRENSDAVDIARFEREAKVAARLKSPYVVRIFDIGVLPTSSEPFFVMEHLDGRSLHKELAQPPVVTTALLLRWVVQIASALEEAHAQGVFHRDVKPSNVFITGGKDRRTSIARLLDFGLATDHNNDTPLTATGTTFGTAGYMAPEQLRSARNVDGRADIFALGVLMYRALSGRYPFNATNFAELAREMATHVPVGLDALVPKEVSPKLCAVVMKAIEVDVERRYQTMSELIAALTPFMDEAEASSTVSPVDSGDAARLPFTVTKTSPAERAHRAEAKRNKRMLAIGGGALVLTLLVGGAALIGLFNAQKKPIVNAPPPITASTTAPLPSASESSAPVSTAPAPAPSASASAVSTPAQRPNAPSKLALLPRSCPFEDEAVCERETKALEARLASCGALLPFNEAGEGCLAWVNYHWDESNVATQLVVVPTPGCHVAKRSPDWSSAQSCLLDKLGKHHLTIGKATPRSNDEPRFAYGVGRAGITN